MNSMRSNLNLRSLTSMGSRIARTRRFQTGMIATVALCAAVFTTGTPAFSASQDAAASGNGSRLAPVISAEEAAAKHQTLKYIALIPEGDSQFAPAATEGEPQLPALMTQDESQYTALLADPDSTSYYGTWTTYPYVNKFLVSFVAYNEYCQEVTAGYWTEGSIGPKYGLVTQALVKGKLSNGDCSEYIYTGAGIFYQWVDKTSSTHDDEFKANWHGAGLENKVTFYLKDRHK